MNLISYEKTAENSIKRGNYGWRSRIGNKCLETMKHQCLNQILIVAVKIYNDI